MPQIFPGWMTSPFFHYFLYVLAGLVLLRFMWMLITRNWRGAGRMLAGLVLIGLVGATLFSGYMKYLFKDFQFPRPTPLVLVQSVALRSFDDRIEALATTQAYESADLTTRVSGIIREINFTEGQTVPAGTVIAHLQDDEQRAALDEAEKTYARSVELARSGAISKARLDSDRARLEIARAQLVDRQITAPFDGVLGLRSVSVGDLVSPGTVITTIDSLHTVRAEFSIPERQIGGLASGQKIQAISAAFPDKVFIGAITALDSRIDPTTRALRVKAEIPNDSGVLRAGMLMRVFVVLSTRESLAVSEEALVSQGQGKSVRIAGAPDDKGLCTIEDRPVTLGARRAGYVEITSGLRAGETVVVDGVIKAAPGAKVKIGGQIPIEATIDRALSAAVEGKRTELAPITSSKQQTTLSQEKE